MARHRLGATAGVVVAALVVGGVAGTTWWVDRHVNCATTEVDTFVEAGEIARDCGHEVEVLTERTPWQSTFATANGDARLEVSTIPTHVLSAGSWVDLDTSLVADPSSHVVEVAASTFPMVLSGGPSGGAGLSPSSTTPLGQIEREGRVLKVWFPLELPVPDVSGSRAVYPLADGIDLHVSINVDGTGFLPVVELADAEAAARFAGMLTSSGGAPADSMDIRFETEVSDDLHPVVTDDDIVQFVDAAGEVHFQAPAPTMWDSSGTEVTVSEDATEVGVTDRVAAAVGGDRIAPLGVVLDGDTIVVTPDAPMLQSSETVWPVYIDPGFSGLGAADWTAVRTGGYTNSLYRWGDISPSSLGQGTGYCNSLPSCNVVFKQRLFWKFTGLSGIGALDSADIVSATFRVNGTHSANCTVQRTNLQYSSDFSSGSRWADIGLGSVFSYRDEYHSNGCGNTGFREFGATAGAQYVASANLSQLTMGLIVNEASITYWKRFRADATLSITYNRAPNVATSLQLISPSVPTCVTGAGRPTIATTTPTMSALVSDPDGTAVYTHWDIYTTAGASVWWNSMYGPFASGTRASVVAPSGYLVDGQSYKWRVLTNDGQRLGPWSEFCEFTVDISAPTSPTVTPVTTGVAAAYLSTGQRGGVGLQGSFTLSRNSSTDVVAFSYGFNAPSMPSTATPDANGNVVINYTPSVAGPVVLSVRSRDAAGNWSATATYSFVVATPTEDAVWMLDEGTGTTSQDLAGDPPWTMTLYGGTVWGEGPHALFDSRAGDNALWFDGVDDHARTSGPVLDTRDSFAVSAHVWLDPSRVGQPQSLTVLSQEGVDRSGFRLEYSGTCPGMPDGCWSFSMPDTASSPVETTVRSTVPVSGGEWTHLVAEFDEPAQSLRLWVCEIGTPSNPAIGEPIRSEIARTATPWAAPQGFQIGRGRNVGTYSGYWQGAIDNVRLFTGEVVSEAKIRRLCQGAEATDFTQGGTALDPTTTVGG